MISIFSAVSVADARVGVTATRRIARWEIPTRDFTALDLRNAAAAPCSAFAPIANADIVGLGWRRCDDARCQL